MSQAPAKLGAVNVVAFAVAVIATSTSIAISVLAGIERGGTAAEQWIWTAIAVVLLVSAHLIPAMVRGAKIVVRISALLLWLAAMASTGYTHGTFFLAAQQHAGDVRAGQVRVPEAPRNEAATRDSISALLRQQDHLQGALNQSALVRCASDCRLLVVRRQTLRDHLDAIKGQLDEARRAEQAGDRQTNDRARGLARQDDQRVDPVSKRLSGWLGLPVPALDLAMAFFFGWLLEGVACLSWYIALPSDRASDLRAGRGAAPVTMKGLGEKRALMPMHGVFVSGTVVPAANDAVGEHRASSGQEVGLERQGPLTVENVDANPESAEGDDEARLREALEAGIATNSIADITRMLRCSEGQALALRRKIAATSPQLLVASS